MEILLKIIISSISLIIILLILFFNVRTWKRQVDVKETVKNLFKISYESDLVIRDENSFYQDGQVVGKIRGNTEQNDGIIKIYDIVNAEKLDLKEPFEYKKLKLRVVSRGPLCLMCNEDGVNLGKTFEWLSCEILSQ